MQVSRDVQHTPPAPVTGSGSVHQPLGAAHVLVEEADDTEAELVIVGTQEFVAVSQQREGEEAEEERLEEESEEEESQSGLASLHSHS